MLSLGEQEQRLHTPPQIKLPWMNRNARLQNALASSSRHTSPYRSKVDCQNALHRLLRSSEQLIKMIFFGHCTSKMNCEKHQTRMPKHRILNLQIGCKNSPLAKDAIPGLQNTGSCRSGPLDLRSLGDSSQLWWFRPAHFSSIWPYLVASLANLGSESRGKKLFGYFILPLGGHKNYYWLYTSRAGKRLIKYHPSSNDAESVWRDPLHLIAAQSYRPTSAKVGISQRSWFPL